MRTSSFLTGETTTTRPDLEGKVVMLSSLTVMTNASTHVQLVGGLGNQLFGLALGRFLEIQHDSSVIYVGAIANRHNSNHGVSVAGLKVFGKVHSEVQSTALLRSKFILSEHFFSKSIGQSSSLLSLNSKNLPRFLRGYFQWLRPTEFLRDRNLLELSPDEQTSRRLQEYRSHYRSEQNFAFLHMRFGDYNLSSAFQIDRERYYLKACNALSDLERGGLEVDVFTDDVESAEFLLSVMRQKIARISFNIHDPRRLLPVDTLLIMSEFKHAIIANSTFSWWGAQLRKNPGSTFHPASWGLDKYLCPEIPEEWNPIKI